MSGPVALVWLPLVLALKPRLQGLQALPKSLSGDRQKWSQRSLSPGHRWLGVLPLHQGVEGGLVQKMAWKRQGGVCGSAWGGDLVKYKSWNCTGSCQGVAAKALYFNCSLRPTVCVCAHARMCAIPGLTF